MTYKKIAFGSECLECGCEFNGRKDKKFCSISCKNDYNNKKNSDQKKYKVNVISKISKNYEILEMLIINKLTMIEINEIEKLGFCTSYITACDISGQRAEYSCFDIKYYQSKTKIYGIRRTTPTSNLSKV